VADDATVREGKGPKAKPSAPSDHERYRPIREIARGGMGRVIEAFDTQLGRTVALKEILDEHHDARARFDREVEITARLEHPSIVPLYDAGRNATGMPFYVMRKVGGDPLDVLIGNASNLDQRLRLLPHVLALADAVAHAHARGVIHRDLKPSNVLVGELGETVVIDWGLAKLIGESDQPMPETSASDSLHTRAGTVFGTPGFMPPEQLRGELVDERADVYALGGCLFHVLAGERPPETTPASFAIAGAPPELLTIIRKAMAPEREQRYLDAGGFSEDLRRFLGGQLVAAHHYPVHARIARWLRRHRTLVAVISLALVVSIAGGVWAVRRILAEQALTEEALAREQQRADDLLVLQASTYLETNPTLAAASLQQLRADSPLWPRLSSLIAGIRARGVAYSYPSLGSQVRFAALSPRDGDHRALLSTRGLVRLTDLVTHTSLTVSEDPDVIRAYWFGSKIAMLRLNKPALLHDPATGTTTDAPWPANTAFSTASDVAVFTDPAGGAVAMDTRGNRVAIPLPSAARSLELSPSGRWLAAAIADRIIVFEARTPLRYEPMFTSEESTRRLAFDDDRRLAISVGRGVVEHDLESVPPKIARRWDTLEGGYPLYLAGDLYWHGFGAIFALESAGPRAAWNVTTLTAAVDHGERGVIQLDDRKIRIAGGDDQILHAPEPIDMIATRKGARFLIASGPSRVFAWDLDEVLSRRSTHPPIDVLSFSDRAHVLGVRYIPTVELHDLRLDDQLALHPGAIQTGTQNVMIGAYPDGTAVALDPDAGQGAIVTPVARTIALAGITTAMPLDAAHVIAGTSAGEIHRISRATGRSVERIATTGFPIRGIGAQDGWILANALDGRLWRRAPDGRVTQTVVNNWRTPSIGPGGIVFVARDRDLLAWETGEPAVVASFAQPLGIPAILKITDSYVIVGIERGGIARFDRLTRTVMPLLPAVRAYSVAAEADLAVAYVNGGLVAVDLTTGNRHQFVAAMLEPQLALSPDGRRLVAINGRDDARVKVFIWQLEPGTRPWLMQATNAISPNFAGAPITWRD
jgi:serine/threonine protein kinase